jgi:hypothetical protein
MIKEGNIKLLRSQVMADVTEGGGRATGEVIVDGSSNSVFADISELDRAGGRVSLRKAFVSVDTLDRDSYYGVNVVVSKPPSDPNVSCAIFTTSDGFDYRSDAQSRLESYLALGPVFAGYLFGTQLKGQMTISILTRANIALPAVGATLVLVQDLKQQFVRITDGTARVREFEDSLGLFIRNEMTLTISDPLREDFRGFASSRYDPGEQAGFATPHETVVADAARYYGTSPLTEVGAIGDFTVQAESIYTQIVPSAQIETPIADARINQQADALAVAGVQQTLNPYMILSPAQGAFIGGSILPGSLTIKYSNLTAIDKDGLLINESTGGTIGAVDYGSGALSVSVAYFPTSIVTYVVTYIPAQSTAAVSKSIGLPVTILTQRLTWVTTLYPAPAPRSLQVSYSAQGTWYTLSDAGSGKLSGSNAAFGVGSLNQQTGTVTLTLGAIPDEGTQIILSWLPVEAAVTVQSVVSNYPTELLADKLFFTFLTEKVVAPGTLSITWNDGVARSAVESNGTFTGDAIGTIVFATGVVQLCPNVLPAKGTIFTVALTEAIPKDIVIPSYTDSGSNWSFSLGGVVKPKTVDAAFIGSYSVREFPGIDFPQSRIIRFFDDGLGSLMIANVTGNKVVGSVNYTTGACTISKVQEGFKDIQSVWTKQYIETAGMAPWVASYNLSGSETRTLTLTVLAGSGATEPVSPAWAWWSGAFGNAARVRFGGSDGDTSNNLTFSPVTIGALSAKNFTFGGSRYVMITAPTAEGGTSLIYKDPSYSTGNGTLVGYFTAIFYSQQTNSRADPTYKNPVLTEWPAGVIPTITNQFGVVDVPLVGPTTAMLVDTVIFRTAVAPLRNGSFSVSGALATGIVLSATSDDAGVILSATASVGDLPGSFGIIGNVKYLTGVINLRFARRVPDAWAGRPGVSDASNLNLVGVKYIQATGVSADTLRYNASAYTYLPLSADILGLDPVRLPSDGRVPIFRAGTFSVVSHTATTAAQTVSANQVVNLGRVRISKVRVIGANGVTITTGYVNNLDAGTVTFTDVTGYSQPIKIENRIEDMMLTSATQISGRLTFTRQLTHAFPIGSYVSSALIIGDMTSRVPLLFDQATWTSIFLDAVIGVASPATYNDVLSPIVVTNSGCVTERWAIQFTSNTSFQVIGEHVGVIAGGTTGVQLAPLNPATGTPYFVIDAIGWGSGWSAGNALRFNTIGALVPIWIARTIQQGPATVQDDSFTLLVRGDIDRP